MGTSCSQWWELVVNRVTMKPPEPYHECLRRYCLAKRDALKPDSRLEGMGKPCTSGRTAGVTRHTAVHGEAGLEGNCSLALRANTPVGTCEAWAIRDQSPAELGASSHALVYSRFQSVSQVKGTWQAGHLRCSFQSWARVTPLLAHSLNKHQTRDAPLYMQPGLEY